MKTFTNFVGTINFWSSEMAKCYAEKKPQSIDLYYNDIYGLDKTLEAFKKSII